MKGRSHILHLGFWFANLLRLDTYLSDNYNLSIFLSGSENIFPLILWLDYLTQLRDMMLYG